MKFIIVIMAIALIFMGLYIASLKQDVDQLYTRVSELEIGDGKAWTKINDIEKKYDLLIKAMQTLSDNVDEDLKLQNKARMQDSLKFHQRLAYCENWIHKVNMAQKKIQEAKHAHKD